MVARDTRRPPLPAASQPRVGDSLLQRALDALYVPLREVLTFLEPYVRQEVWTDLTFFSTWASSTSGYEVGSYRKDPWGRVWLRGTISRSGGGVTTIATLPEGYRPALSRTFGLITVYSDGLVAYTGAAGAVTASLDGVSFDTEGA